MQNLISMFHVKRLLFLLVFLPTIGFTQHFGTTTLAIKTLPAPPSRINSIDQNLNKSLIYNSLDPIVKEWYYWTNYSRNNPKRFWDSIIVPILKIYPDLKSSYTNSLEKDLMSTPPLPFVTPNAKLLTTAKGLAQELSTQNSPPSHTSPSGKTFQERMRDNGIINCAGENLSYGTQNPILMLVLLYIDQGVPQVGHRKSLLNPLFVEMGVGYAPYSNGNSITIQDFGCKQ